MSAKEPKRKTSLDCVPWNESGSLERSSLDIDYNHKDFAIFERLQYLTQRVEYLEHKLENSLSSNNEELSLGLSVKNENNVPNVDIKVLSGHREGDDAMEGWDDAIVERNTSFLIIPVGDETQLQANQEQLIQQTFGISVKPSQPALRSPDTYHKFIEDNERKKQLPSVAEDVCDEAIKTSVVCMEIRPPKVTTFVQPSSYGSIELEDSNNTKEKNTHDLEESKNSSRHKKYRKQHVNNGAQKTDKKDNMSKLTTTVPQQDCNNNENLKYGYTVSVTRSPTNDSEAHSLPYTRRLPPDDRCEVRQDGKHISPIQCGILNTSADNLTPNVSTVLHPSYVVKSKNLPTQESVCYQGVEVREVFEYEDKLKYDRDNDITDRTIVKIQRRISNENCVYPQGTRRAIIDNQLKNSKYSRNESTASVNEMINGKCFEMDDDSFIEKKLQNIRITSDNSNNPAMIMQIPHTGSKSHQEGYCVDGPYIPLHNDASVKRLNNNNNNQNTNNPQNIEFCTKSDNMIQRNFKHHVQNSKPAITKARVRSLDIPSTSSEDEIHSVSSDLSDSYNYRRELWPPRRRPKSRSSKETTPKDIQHKLRELRDHRDAREEVQTQYRSPLLLSVMSPTESGYAGSSRSSPRDDWRDSSFTSVSPLAESYPDSSSQLFDLGGSTNYIEAGHLEYHTSHRIPYLSVSSPSSVSDVSEYSEKQNSKNLSSSSIGNTRLSDVLPGPARLALDDCSPMNLRLNEFLLSASDDRSMSSPASSVITSDLSDSFLDCHDDCCQCQTGISTEDDFREELKEISRYVIEANAKSGLKKKRASEKKYYLDEEQGEMDIFGSKLQKGEHRAVPLLVKVILRLRKHFFGGLEGPNALKSLSPRQSRKNVHEENRRERKISFSPSAMLLSAVEESSASEIRDVIEKDRLDVNELSPGGKTLLHKVAASGNLDSIHALIQYGALVNLPDEDGFVPIHAALRQSHYKCAVFLIECGTDIGLYTRARIQELADINNMFRAYKKTVLNTAL